MTTTTDRDWAAEAVDHWDESEWRRALMADLTRNIWERFEAGPFLTGGADVEFAEFTERIFIKNVLGKKAVWLDPEGRLETTWVKASILEAPRGQLKFHFVVPEGELRQDFSVVTGLADKAASVLRGQFNARAFSLLAELDPAALVSPHIDSTALAAGKFAMCGGLMAGEYSEDFCWHLHGRCDVAMLAVLPPPAS